MSNTKVLRRQKLRHKIRKSVIGTAEKLRLSVFRSNTNIFAQLIDDTKGNTIVSASSKDKDIKTVKGNKVETSKLVGNLLAKKAVALGIKTCVFDRSGYLYHGRVKSLADGAREGGLDF